MANDTATWPFLGAGENPLPSRAKQPMDYSVDMGTNGYPNNIPNTQTLRTRGTKNTTRGNSSSTKMG
jgi:hypothetical protein